MNFLIIVRIVMKRDREYLIVDVKLKILKWKYQWSLTNKNCLVNLLQLVWQAVLVLIKVWKMEKPILTAALKYYNNRILSIHFKRMEQIKNLNSNYKKLLKELKRWWIIIKKSLKNRN